MSPATAERTGSAAALPDPPGPPGRLAFLRALRFGRNPLQAIQRLQRRYGDVAMSRLGPRRLYVLSHPDLVRDVLVTNHRNFIKSFALQRARVLLGEGLLTSEGDVHLRQRRLAQPAFHRDRVAAMAGTMARYAEDAADRWRAGMEVDATREMNRLTLAIAGMTLLGVDVEGEADEIGRSLTAALGLFDRLHNPLAPLLDRLPVPGTLRMRRARERLDATIYRAIAERRASAGARDDLLGMLLAARDEEGDGGGMTDLQLRDELLTLFLAGHETTANALAWTWHLLALHPRAEARLHDELRTVLAGRVPTAQDYAALPFTRAVFAESMRLHPPAWTVGREPLRDFEAGGYRIRAGSIVLTSPWIIHRDPRWWGDAEVFRPERWMEPDFEASLRLLSLWRRAAQVHRRGVRVDGGGPRAGDAGPPLAPAPRPRRAGRRRAADHPARRRPADARGAGGVITRRTRRNGEDAEKLVSASSLFSSAPSA